MFRFTQRLVSTPLRAGHGMQVPGFSTPSAFTSLRYLSSTTKCQAGEPTKLHNILGNGPTPPVQVRGLTPAGIELADGLILPGACVFLEGEVFLWDVPMASATRSIAGPDATQQHKWTGWENAHFALFDAVVPKPEILILGTGKRVSHPPPAIKAYLNGIGIQLDVMDTRNACTTYNLLAEEGRRVAAALLPVMSFSWRPRKSA